MVGTGQLTELGAVGETAALSHELSDLVRLLECEGRARQVVGEGRGAGPQVLSRRRHHVLVTGGDR